MKCEHCQSELFLGSRYCPVCGAVTRPPEDGVAMSRTEFFRLALPQKFQSIFHTGVLLCYFSVLVSLVLSFWMPVSGMIQAIICLCIAVGLQVTKSVAWAYLGTVLSSASLVVSMLTEGNFVCLITLTACIFASVGSHALAVSYAAYIAGGKTPELGDEEGRAMAVKYQKRRKFRIVSTAVGGLLIGALALTSGIFYVAGRSADRDFAPGKLTDGGLYVHDFADIRVQMPDGWIVYDQKSLGDRIVSTSEDVRGLEFLTLSPDRSISVRLDVVRQSSAAYTAEDLLESCVDSGRVYAEASGQNFSVGESQRRTLGDQEYLCLATTQTDAQGGTFCLIYLCRQIGSYSVIFRLSAPSQEVLDEFSDWFVA